MAIAVQTSGADGPSSNGSASSSRSVTLAAGGSRLLLVAVCSEGASSGSTVTTGVTYGGVALSRVTDGTDTAQVSDVPDLEWWCLRNAQMPADGAQSLVVSVSAGRSHGVGWYILTGASQGANATDVTGTATNTGAVSVQVSPNLVASGSFVGTIAYKDNTGPGTIEVLSIDALGTTVLSAQNHTESGARFVIGHRIPVVLGLIVSLYVTVTDGGRRAMLTIVVPPASTTPSASAGFTAGGATFAATTVHGHPVSAGFAAGGATLATTAVHGHPASAAFASGDASMAATASKGMGASAGFVATGGGLSATASRGYGVTAAFASGDASMAAPLARGRELDAAFPAGEAMLGAELGPPPIVGAGARVRAVAPATRATETAAETTVTEMAPWSRVEEDNWQR